MLPVFLIFWIVLNDRITTELLVLGVLLDAVVFLVAWRYLGYSFKKDLRMLRSAPFYLMYLGNLVLAMLQSTLQVARLVLSMKYEAEPVVVEFDADFRTRFGQVMMANYITMTPGTITVDVEKNHFTVHCLDAAFAPDPATDRMVPIIRKMEG